MVVEKQIFELGFDGTLKIFDFIEGLSSHLVPVWYNKSLSISKAHAKVRICLIAAHFYI